MRFSKYLILVVLLSLAVTGAGSAALVTSPTPTPTSTPSGEGTFSIEQTTTAGEGEVGIATLYMNNTWQPQADDVWVLVSWDGTYLDYAGTDWLMWGSVSALRADPTTLLLRYADRENRYPNGNVPVANISFRGTANSTSRLTVRVYHVHSHLASGQPVALPPPLGTATTGTFVVGDGILTRPVTSPPTMVPTPFLTQAAGFPSLTWAPVNPVAGEPVQFASVPDPDSNLRWFWDFGDDVISDLRHPVHSYASAGTYTAGVFVVYPSGGAYFGTKNVTVGARPLTAGFGYSPRTPTAGETVAFTDASAVNGGAIASWAWTFGDGTGSVEQSPVHRYSLAGTYPVTLTVTDTAGHSDSHTADVAVAYAPPEAAFSFLPQPVAAGGEVSFTSESTVNEGSITAWEWDFADGATDTDPNPVHPFSRAGTYNVTLTVTDSNGGTDTDFWPLVVSAPDETAYALVPPATVEEGHITVETGATAQRSVTVAGDTIEVAMNGLTMTIVTDGLTATGGAIEGDIVAVGLRNEPVVGEVQAGPVSASFDAMLADVDTSYAIAVNITQTAAADVRSAYELVATENGVDILNICYAFNVIGASVENGVDVTGATITMTAAEAWVEAQGGPENVRIFRQGDDGLTEMLAVTSATLDQGVYTFVADSPHGLSVFGLAGVADAPPAIRVEAAAPNPAPVGTGIAVTAVVDDGTDMSGGLAAVTYSLDGVVLGSVTPDAGTVRQAVTIDVPGSATVGVHCLEIGATDGAGHAASLPLLLVVYDPSAGFVTGGGWIASPAGAYSADTAMTGRANFGFVSKYRKGATVPTGETQFVFRAADFTFRSTGYDWLVIAGAKAQYKGSGTINGAGDYGFMLSAVDGQASGGGGADRFRFKVWDRATGATVYDSQRGSDEAADPATAISDGSIVIHKS